MLELPALADEGAHERSMVRVPDEVGVPIESVRPRRRTQRQLPETGALRDAADSADELLVKVSFCDAPSAEAGVETCHPLVPAVGPGTTKIDHDPSKGSQLAPNAVPHWHPLVAGRLNKLIDGVEDREGHTARETTKGGVPDEDLDDAA